MCMQPGHYWLDLGERLVDILVYQCACPLGWIVVTSRLTLQPNVPFEFTLNPFKLIEQFISQTWRDVPFEFVADDGCPGSVILLCGVVEYWIITMPTRRQAIIVKSPIRMCSGGRSRLQIEGRQFPSRGLEQSCELSHPCRRRVPSPSRHRTGYGRNLLGG